MIAARYSRADVVDALTTLGVERLLDRHGIKFRRTGGEVRFQICPDCGPRSRPDAVAANIESGLWVDHAHGCRGSLLDLASKLAGVDPARDFSGALASVAESLGLAASDETTVREREAQAEARRAEHARQAAKDAADRLGASAALAGPIWDRLARRSNDGEAYLASRGLGELVGRDDLVRFDRSGGACVALRAFEPPRPIFNVVVRRLPPATPKVLGLKGCPTSGAFGDVAIESFTGHVVLVEGVFDFLTAKMIFGSHGNAVVGAHGGGNVRKIAEALAPQLRQLGRRFLFVPHEDSAGESAVDGAITAAVSAGIEFGGEVDLFNLGGAKDLNMALQGRCGDVRDFI